jgi:hypothetical protein
MTTTGADGSGLAAAQPRPGASSGPGLGALSAATATVWLVLLALQQSSRLPAAWGIEDWLGWHDAASVVAAVQGWCLRPQRLLPPAAYLLVDQMLFVPLYAAWLLRAATGLAGALSAGQARRGLLLVRLLRRVLPALLLALVLADTLENAVGLHNLGQSSVALVLAVCGSVVLALALMRPLPLHGALWAALAAAGTAVVLVTLVARTLGACADVTDPVIAFTAAHDAKLVLASLVLLLVLAGAVAWCFGFEFDPQGQQRARDDRATIRTLATGVVGRSRYVLLIVGVFGALTLGLDQCRDVLLALADVPDLGWSFWLVRLPVLLLGPLAAALFAHACWLWARLAGMVQRPGVVLPQDPAVLHAVGLFARHWARALALVPLAMVAVLVAFTLGDLALAAGAVAPADAPGAVGEQAMRLAISGGLLLLFAVGAMVIAGLLLRARQRQQHEAVPHYYNSEPDVWALLWYQSGRLQDRDERRPLWWRWATVVTRPWLLPLLALLGMAVLRVLMAEWPSALASSPPTLALLMLALTWWLGVLGLLSLWEQKHSMPWILLPLAVVGLLSALGLTDNHALAWPAALDVTAARVQGQTAMLLLVLACSVGWWAAVSRPDDWQRSTRLQRRWPVLALTVALTGGGLVVIDRASAVVPAATPAAAPVAVPATGLPVDAPRLQDALVQWLARAEAAGVRPGPLYLVAAEGGGIRSAYWTAQVLAALGSERGPAGFADRTLLMSGVSGGSMGMALYRACGRLAALQRPASMDAPAVAGTLGTSGEPTDPVARCIDAGFDRLDALSPLLGGLFFEDVLGRLLPASRQPSGWGCSQPGCAQLDRAAHFEREWMRVFPPLGEPLQAAHSREPLLAFNSTWVETGNRTVAASWPLAADAFPAATQLRLCLGADVRLITAAHTSARFPGTNPLAGVHAPVPADAACRSGGHLIDGGYFDNSALPTVLDALRALAPRLAGSGWQPVVVVIRNGRRPAQCEPGPSGAPLPRCVLPDTGGSLTDPRTLDGASDRRHLQLYADMLGPALALLNVSGVGAHGRDSGAALRATLGEVGQGCEASALRLIDQVDDGSLVPLGWYLSPAARLALRRQVALKVPGQC